MKRLLYLLASLIIIIFFVVVFLSDFSKPESKVSIGSENNPRINEITPEPNRILPPARD